jgi:hypothetical protein
VCVLQNYIFIGLIESVICETDHSRSVASIVVTSRIGRAYIHTYIHTYIYKVYSEVNISHYMHTAGSKLEGTEMNLVIA